MVKEMTLAEKVNVTTGTGWQMGLCVGNTGRPLLSSLYYGHANTDANCVIQDLPNTSNSLLFAYKTARLDSDSRKTLQPSPQGSPRARRGTASLCKCEALL